MSTESGKAAESAAADYLGKKGWEIVSANWRNRWCEIDLIMKSTTRNRLKKNQILHFVEVKYRANSEYGSGFEYITSDKLRRMKLAAEHWLLENEWHGPWQIDVVSVSGSAPDYSFEEIENVTM